MKIRKEVAFLTAALISQGTYAITPANLTPSEQNIFQQVQQATAQRVNPGRVQQDFITPSRSNIRQTTPVVGENNKATNNLPPEFQKIKFTLTQLTITGPTVYSKQELLPFYQQYLGKKINLAQLFNIAQTITDKYHKDGYILSQAVVPAQRIQKNGHAEIRVVEGYVNKIIIQGDAHGATNTLLGYGNQIKNQQPLRAKTLERYALLANDLPGIDVQTILAPSKDTPGAADLTFITQAKRFDVSASYDNRGTVFFGPYELTAQADINNLFTANQTGIQGLATKDFTQLQYVKVWHNELLGNDGLQLGMNATLTRTNPGASLEPLIINGQSKEYIVSLQYPLLLSRRQNLYINGMFDSLDSVSYANLFDPAALLFKDKIRSLRIGGTYELTDSLLGINNINLQMSQGLNILGAPDHTVDPPAIAPTPSRPAGRSDYTKFNLRLSRTQFLPKNFSILLATSGQYALNPLLSPEQMGYGGREFGRAYDPSEITGDSGILGEVELRWTAVTQWPLLQAVQPYAYFDGGKVWNRDSITQASSASGTSAGGGLRFTFTNSLLAGVEVDQPLSRKVSALSSPDYDYKNPRVFFYIQGFF